MNRFRIPQRHLAALALAAALPAFATPPRIAGCEVFPPDNVWNTRVDNLRVHASSATWVGTIGATKNLHPDFGTFYLGEPIGIPFTTVPATQPRVGMAFDVPAESEPGPYPIPADAPIEGGATATGDRHVLVLERDNCILYELDAAYPQAGGAWHAFSGAVFDLKANAIRPDTWTSADAAGLPILPGLVRRDEVLAGEIRHALRFTAPQTRRQHLWPATHDASSLTGAQYPPMGARFRLKAGFDESGYSPEIRVVLRALKRYGMILADNGSSWFLSGEHNPAWDDNLLGELKRLQGSDFEAVETAPLEVSASSTAAFPPPPPIALRAVAGGFTEPTAMAAPPDGSGRLFVLEKAGYIRIVRNGAVLPTPFLDIHAQVTSDGERGLLGLAFDPQYAASRRFFIYYTGANGDIHISSFLADAGNADAAAAGETDVMTFAHPVNSNHNGGALLFGPDGYLYAGVGDGGSANDPPNNAQTMDVPLGKILRLDVGAASGHAIPPDNPFVGVPGVLPEIWSMGLRNPWRMSFDRLSGDLFIGDVGQNAIEELDWIAAGTRPPFNFLWRICEGLQCSSSTAGVAFATFPVLQYLHDAQGGFAITGGYAYRGLKIPALQGYYVFGDFSSNRIWAATRVGGAWTKFVLSEAPNGLGGISSFGEDADGELYVVSFDGVLYAIDGPARDVDTPPPLVGEAPRQVDFDNDGRGDLAWKHGSGAHGVWDVNGLAVSAAGALAAPANATLRLVAHLAGASQPPYVIWRQPDGAYSASRVSATQVTSTRALLPAGSGWEVVGTGDFDGDGHADLLWRSAGDAYGVWLMDGDTPRVASGIAGPGAGWEVAMVGRFTGTARSDLLWRHVDGSVRVAPMTGASAGAPLILQGPGAGWRPTHAGDLDGNGSTDIAWAHPDGRVRLSMMSAGGAATTQVLGPWSGWKVAGVADLDGDGHADLLWRDPAGVYGAWLMDGAAVRSAAALLSTPGTGWEIVGAADLDGNGTWDLLWRDRAGSYGGWLMNGLRPTDAALLLHAGTRWELAP